MPWRTGLCDCCAPPGGCGLCFIAFCLPCITLGDNNEWLKGPLGWIGGFLVGLTSLCTGFIGPCICTYIHARDTQTVLYGPQSAQEQGDCKMLCTSYCCEPCFMCQIRREQLLSGKQVMPVAAVGVAQPTVYVQQGGPAGEQASAAMSRQKAPLAEDEEAIWSRDGVDPESLEQVGLLSKNE